MNMPQININDVSDEIKREQIVKAIAPVGTEGRFVVKVTHRNGLAFSPERVVYHGRFMGWTRDDHRPFGEKVENRLVVMVHRTDEVGVYYGQPRTVTNDVDAAPVVIATSELLRIVTNQPTPAPAVGA